jgi:alkanesulfonate monooxygenase SsuD/methylene tetrahydromethanopterin reductase-like flavin-dependent oxidoreductase (luciferase family)
LSASGSSGRDRLVVVLLAMPIVVLSGTRIRYQEMFAAAGYPEARQATWSREMIEAVVLHGTEDECRRKLDPFMRTSGCDEVILSIMFVGADRNASLQRALQ